MKKILAILLSISIGILFIVSAATKIYPMEPFEYQFVDIGMATWKTAPYIARFFIGVEFFLGLLLIFNILLRRFTIKFAIALLVVFCIYLVYRIILDGNVGNCGCFGEAIKMSPLEGILKNIVLIVSCVVIYFITTEDAWKPILKKIFIPIFFITSMCLGFFIYPIDAAFSSTLDKTTVNYKVPLELMYKETQVDKPKIDLTKGKHVIAFLSLTCPHCKIAAKKMNVMHKKNPNIPFYYALNGDKELLNTFLEDTNTKDVPHSLFLGPQDWMQVAGISLPVIMYIENSIVIKKTNGLEIDQTDIENWLKK
jgi:thiol-disulfide isomerase/thioredoxin